MIRVVNLMIGLPSTVNLHRRRRTLYEPNVLRPVYILEKNQNVNWMGDHPIHICKWKCESDSPSSGLQFLFQNVNRMGGIRFSILFFLKSRRFFWSLLQKQFWHF